MIHPTAIISDKNVKIGDNVTIGPFSIVEENVEIGDGVTIASHALIGSGARIHNNVNVFIGAVVSGRPQDLKYNDEETTTIIGENTIIREYVTIHRGTDDKWQTVVGKDCLIMAYCHIAHDCTIGDNVILSNSCNMAGHVTIEDFAAVGGMVPIHQFVTIGCHSFIGGGFRVSKDVPPYIRASNSPLTYNGLNSVGLRRRGFTSEMVSVIKEAYQLIYRSTLNVSQAILEIREKLPQTKEIQVILDFIEKSKRGII
ncbi:MAG TPA: acyl-[acyl-carrier-protein]--UDP-N-acetylglucosamine O-acyltransferase [Candidatus Marinimicrobia bacterium]|nr:MAG: acyl-[acyl-carrier-protein]--UDP-N-acetylglucosamine O-acyltransferase [Candidatus Marinimicrobia bacterium CG1_02_48_14]PIZ65566.1 MAG: acyl-[acyl-carrier-protein]--UDP-N-acetylglucosamine O-acyltransferase [Candidatus Marinimicrobia bacterium CG_4_10_14_0_2_um_filter_48_9]PJA52323.1 MAG: acyl-[acyl-carrier-protein]--UDP-N-acetylglucosamine O-acyltransferase [Candidatus Marinimicrobia bacterium CG_4_9_14_3_um_filter_48_9]HCW75427.1 acyl-[acyl-carrier-protein]--UDP-N-acetylglucosamine O-